MRLLEIGPLDPDYPAGLRPMGHAPRLWWWGTAGAADERCVALVGTRSPTPAGLARARSLARELADAGVTVVSGLARGIDTAAHEACLDAGGRTVAVLGCGAAQIYPPENAGLADRIAAHGAVLSQLPPDAPVSPAALRRRNADHRRPRRHHRRGRGGSHLGEPASPPGALSAWADTSSSPTWRSREPWAEALLARPGVCRLAPDAGVGPLLARLAEAPPTAPIQLALAMSAGR